MIYQVINYNDLTPFCVFPQGENLKERTTTPSPVGEGWEGGYNNGLNKLYK